MKNIKLIRCLLLLALGLQIRCATTGTNIKKNSKEAEVYLKRVSSEVVENQSKKKKCIVESHIEKQSWENIVAKGNACVSAGNFYQVERYGDYLATEHHLGPWGPYFLSLAAEHRGEKDRALWMVELALKKAPGEGLIIYQKGRLVWGQNEYALAVDLFESAVKARPDLLGAHLFLGQIYYRDQEFSKAKSHLKLAIEMDSSQSAVWAALAECELEDKNPEPALIALERAIRLDSKNFDYRMREAYIYEKVLNKPTEALTVYKKIHSMGKALKLNQNVTNTLNEKIQQLTTQLAKAAPGEQVSQRKPAKEEEVSQ